ncbi:Bud site selection protein 6 [Nowakowskiella sp. JEL0078]|nr:Bud site selection protein 6 [Nowakowskiella sp. JEL0078]
MAFLRLNTPGITPESLKKHIDLSFHSLTQSLKQLKLPILPRKPISASAVLNALSRIRQILTHLKTLHTHLHTTMNQTLTSLNDHLEISVSPTPRQTLLSTQQTLMIHATTLPNQITALQQYIDDLKHDILRCLSPPPSRLRYISTESSRLVGLLETMEDDVINIKREWKAVWEDELKRIVKEQAFLKKWEDDVAEWVTDARECSEVADGLGRVVELGLIKNSVVVEVASPDEIGSVLSVVLNEIRLAVGTGDGEKRLRAIERNEERRRLERQIDGEKNEFWLELKNFIGKGCLKKFGGGIEELEKSREKKRIAIVKTLMGSGQ